MNTRTAARGFLLAISLSSIAGGQSIGSGRNEAPRLLKVAGAEAAGIVQQAYIKASNPDQFDFFGVSADLSGDTLVVGAGNCCFGGESSSSRLINGDQNDNSAQGAGAAYVFVRNNGAWVQEAYLKAFNTDAGDGFGQSVAISGDTIVVGAPEERSAARGINQQGDDNSAASAGAAYVFRRANGVWTQEAYLKASNTDSLDTFGTAVDIDGERIVVGASREDSAAIGVMGDQTDNQASNSGAAYVFARNGTTWTQEAYLKASNTDPGDFFGVMVNVSGDTIAVTSPGEASGAPGVSGNQQDNSTPSAGAAYVFVLSGTSWTQQSYVKASNPSMRYCFGESLALDGNALVVGSPEERSLATGVNGSQVDANAFSTGAAYVFFRAKGQWTQEAYLKASNTDTGDGFGRDVDVSGRWIAVGAWQEDSLARGIGGLESDNSVMDSGAVYLFTRGARTWRQADYIKSSNSEVFDRFGRAVALGSDTLISTAINEDSNATGVNGNENDNSANGAGAAFAFDLRSLLLPQPYGATTGANIACLSSAQMPVPLSFQKLDISGFNGSGTALLGISTDPVSIPLLSGTLLIDLQRQFFTAGEPQPVSIVNGIGQHSVFLPPTASGHIFYAQAVMPDASQAGGLAFTNGLELALGR